MKEKGPRYRLTVIVACGNLGEYEAYKARRFAADRHVVSLYVYATDPGVFSQFDPKTTKVIFTGTYWLSPLWDLHRARDARMRKFAVERDEIG